MKLFYLFFLLLATSTGFSQGDFTWKSGNAAGYEYKYVKGDPMKTRFYVLKNGLTVMLSENHKEPRIAYRMAVRAGSNNDPANHTGLAHYLEHLLFKGTSQYGSLDWSKEKPYLEQINVLYEKYNKTQDSVTRKIIYRQIDSISGIASHYAIASEYQHLMTDIGSQQTNAHTWFEETVYEEDIPNNAVDKFLSVQAERFRDPQFRLFHTELEAVYEEKNRGLDNDDLKMWEALLKNLFPTNNYGQQSTIGTIEHLKNPSLLAIRDFYKAYYVPDNMAFIFSGDFNSDSLIGKIDQSFSYMKPKPVDIYNPPAETPIANVVTKEIFGPTAENMTLGFRTPAANTRDALVLGLISNILYNGKAGLLDLNLNQQQRVQSSDAFIQQFRDYGVLVFDGKPKENQSLVEVKELILQQIEKLKKGDFDANLLKAITANNKLNQLLSIEENGNRVTMLMDAFIKSRGDRWDYQVAAVDEQSKISKEEVIRVANQWMGLNSYVLLYKRTGVDSSIVKVVKPPITAIETNAGKQSDFVKKVAAMPLTTVQPMWLNFDTQLTKSKAGIADVLYVPNTDNELFSYSYRFDMGKWNDKLLPIAAEYINYIGTDKYSAEEITKMFYSLACSFSISVENEITTVNISGLQRNFQKASSLFEELITQCKPNEEVLSFLKDRLLNARTTDKTDKDKIKAGMQSYAIFGAKNPFNAVLTNDEIKKIQASELVSLLNHLMQYRHQILYYGPMSVSELTTAVIQSHILPKVFVPYPEKSSFPYKATVAEVLFSEYDMVQTEIYWVNKGGTYDASKEAMINVFNNYFGRGMNSVVFQTIRESKALAYSTFAQYQIPSKKENSYITLAYVGCQADKMSEAMQSMNTLLQQIPLSEQRFSLAKSSFKNDLETERITKENIIYAYLKMNRKGWMDDHRKQEYQMLGNMTLKDLSGFYSSQVSGRPYTYCVIGSDKKVDKEALKKFGEIRTLSLKEIFGY